MNTHFRNPFSDWFTITEIATFSRADTFYNSCFATSIFEF